MSRYDRLDRRTILRTTGGMAGSSLLLSASVTAGTNGSSDDDPTVAEETDEKRVIIFEGSDGGALIDKHEATAYYREFDDVSKQTVSSSDFRTADPIIEDVKLVVRQKGSSGSWCADNKYDVFLHLTFNDVSDVAAGIIENLICETIEEIRDEHIIELKMNGEQNDEIDVNTIPVKAIAAAVAVLVCATGIAGIVAKYLKRTESTGSVNYTVGMSDDSTAYGRVPTIEISVGDGHVTDISVLDEKTGVVGTRIECGDVVERFV